MATAYDPNKDYSALLSNPNLSSAERAQYTAEREAKIADMYGGKEPTMANSAQTFSQVYGRDGSGGSSGSSGGYNYGGNTTLQTNDRVSGITRTASGTPYSQTGVNLSGVPLNDWVNDLNDYSARAASAQGIEELNTWLAKREMKAAAQGIDISGNTPGILSNDQIKQQWYNTYGNYIDSYGRVSDTPTGRNLTYTPSANNGAASGASANNVGSYANAYNTVYGGQSAGQSSLYADALAQMQAQFQSQLAQQQSQSDALIAQLKAQYDGQQSEYNRILAEQQAAQEAAVQKAVNSMEGQKEDTNTAYSNYYRQAYIDRMNAQKNLNQRLAAQGLTGGASESAMLGLSTAYSDALRQAEQSRIGALSDLDRAISDARLTGDIESANAAASTIKERTDNYANVLQSLINRYDTIAARQQAYDREDEQLAWNRNYQLSRDAVSDAQNNRSYATALVNNLISNGIVPDEESLAAAGYSTGTAQSMLEAINAQRARDLADYYAQYGDYSGLAGLGIDTSTLTSQQSSGGSRSGSGTQSGTSSLMSGDIYARMADAGASDYGTAYDMLRSSGYSVTDANRYASYFAETYLPSRTGTQATAMATSTGGMNEATFNQEARTIMAYLGQGMVSQAQSRLARIWDSLSASQQQALNNALVNNGYTS